MFVLYYIFNLNYIRIKININIFELNFLQVKHLFDCLIRRQDNLIFFEKIYILVNKLYRNTRGS